MRVTPQPNSFLLFATDPHGRTRTGSSVVCCQWSVVYERATARNPVAPGMGFGGATIGHPGRKPFVWPALRISSCLRSLRRVLEIQAGQANGAPDGHGSEAETYPGRNGESVFIRFLVFYSSLSGVRYQCG